MQNIFFDNWESIWRTFIITIFAYVGLIVLLRISGKRTLSKMNAFDFIVTIALGSTLATVMLNKDVALVDGLLAFAMLIFLQYIITFLSIRRKKMNDLVKSTPCLLVFGGEMLPDAMMKERITEDEIMAFLREQNTPSLQEAGAVVLETDGSLTLLSSITGKNHGVLKGVR